MSECWGFVMSVIMFMCKCICRFLIVSMLRCMKSECVCWNMNICLKVHETVSMLTQLNDCLSRFMCSEYVSVCMCASESVYV